LSLPQWGQAIFSPLSWLAMVKILKNVLWQAPQYLFYRVTILLTAKTWRQPVVEPRIPRSARRLGSTAARIGMTDVMP
jgi:hypothetical protein